MKDRKSWKKALSVLLSTAMVVGLIGVAGPKPVKAADPEANVLTNGDFEDASNASWKDQDGTLVGAQKVVDKITRTDYFTDGGFENGSDNYGQSGANAAVVDGAGIDGSKALKFTRSESETGVPYVYFAVTGLDTTGTVTYTVSFKIRSTGAHWQGYIVEKGVDNWGAIGWTAANTEWVEHEYTFTTTTGKAQIGLQAIQGAGDIYVDDFCIYTENVEYETVKQEKYTDGGFENGSDNYGQSGANAAVIDGAGIDGSKALKFTRSESETGVPYVYFVVTGLDTAGTVTYTVSFKIRSTGAHWQGYIVEKGVDDWGAIGWTAANTEWVEHEYAFTTTTGKAQIGLQAIQGAGDIYVDDFSVSCESTGVAQTYTEGIGTCKDTEPDNVLAMKDFSKVTQNVTIKEGNRYDYSFKVKKESAEDSLTFGVTACGNAAEAVTVTDAWTEVSGSFTATADAAEFGFTRSGTGTVLVDDVVLNETAVGPSDHTSMAGGGAYIPEGNVSVYGSDMSTAPEGLVTSDFNNLGGAITNGMMKLPFTTTQYVPISVSVTENVTYTLSYYVWIEDAETGNFEFNIYYTGAGIGWIDKGADSILKDTYGWVKIEKEVTPTSTGTLQIGFKNYGSGAGTVYLDDICLSAAPTGEATDISFTYDTTKGYNFHYEQENRLYMGSTGTIVKNLRGNIVINGTTKEITYQHYNGYVVVLFNGLLDTDKVNEVTIPAGTILWDGITRVYEIAEEFTIYTQRVAEGQWMTWQNEYPLEQKVQYFDMGTSDSEYTFNNNPTIAYQGVVIVTKPDNTKVVLGGTSANQSTVETSMTVKATGDYLVSKVIQGEKYDYTVALYKRGDADSTMDGTLNSKDLVAVKKAVSAEEAAFGYARYKAADANTDGVVDENDAAFMRHILAGGYDITTTTSKGYSTLGQGVMPIVGYGGPSDHTCKQNSDATARSSQGGIDNLLDGTDGERTFELMKELGINVFSSDVHEVGDYYDISSRMLKMAEKYGIGVYLNNAYIRNDPSGQISLQTAKYENFGSFHGYYVADEPSNGKIGNFKTILDTLKNKVNIASYFNMLPISDANFILGGYTDYLNNAAATSAETISYDLYLRAKDGEIRTKKFYQNLDEARTASMNASKPFQAFVQTGANWIDKSSDSVSSSNRLTIQEMYLEANAALAMGAKGIHYFTLIESANQVAKNDNDSGLITIKGEKNNNEGGNYAYYDAAQKINTYIAKVDEVLMNATSKGVITNSTIQGYMSGKNTKLSAYGAVTSVTGTNAFVGCFDYYGKNAYMVVNTSTSASETITLNMADSVSYKYTGMDCVSHTESGVLTLTDLGAGESVLIVVD